MALGVDGAPAGRVIGKTALLTLGTVGFVFFLTLMFHSMRAVMDVGGTCAEGGPFEIRQPCPEGAAWIMPVSIFGGLASLGIGAIGVFKQGGPRPYVFVWSALFLALGWNFLEYGFDPPDGSGSAWGWIVCGVVFVLMGGVPLLGLLLPSAARWALWGPKSEGASPGAAPYERPSSDHVVAPTTTARPTHTARASASPPTSRGTPSTSTGRAAPSGDIVSRLERLADLHDRGAIDDAEYDMAKDAILRNEVGR